MKLTICLAKTTLLFYLLLTPFIVIGSLYNLVKGVILHQQPVVHISAFALFGFVLLPLLLVVTYMRNRCVIDAEGVRLGKVFFRAADYSFAIEEYYLPFKDRPLFSLLKKNYHALVIKEKKTGEIEREIDLDVFKKDIEKIEAALLANWQRS